MRSASIPFNDPKELRMIISLPGPVAAYFIADKVDQRQVANCFTEDATVEDEGRTHKGRAAIEQWKKASSARYEYTSEPFASEQDGDMIVVLSRLAGNFPGSPLDLRYFFELKGDKIASLEIRL